MAHGQQKKNKLTPHAVIGDNGRTVDDADDAGQCLREYWSKIFRAREDIAHEVNPEDVKCNMWPGPRTMLEEDFCAILARN